MDAIAYETSASSDAVPEALYAALPEKGPRPIPSAREILERKAKRLAAEAETAECERAAQLMADTIAVTPVLNERIQMLADKGWAGMRIWKGMPQGMTHERFVEVGRLVLSEPPYKTEDSWFELTQNSREGCVEIDAIQAKPAEPEARKLIMTRAMIESRAMEIIAGRAKEEGRPSRCYLC